MDEEKRFSIGNQTAWFARGITEPFEYAVSNGFDAFEWFPDKKDTGEGWSEDELAEETRVYIKDTASANGIRLSVHVPWRWNPFTVESKGEMDRALRLAEDVGAVVMNIHFYKERGAAAFAEAIGPLVHRLSRRGISLSIENTPETSPEDFNELFRILGKGGGKRPDAGMCIDLGHANLCHTTRNDYLRYIDLLDEDLPVVHAHLHENYGDSDRHLPLFTGPSARDDSGIRGFIDRMKKRGFAGSLILEQWPDPPRLINEARDRLLFIIGIPKEVPEEPGPEIPAGDFAQAIAAADRKRRSWREKLGWVHGLFSDDAPDLTTEQLVYIAVYLRFLAAGEVRVSEDGSHYRPSHHARMAKDIFARLTRMENPDNFFILRRIYPCLPSFAGDFLRPEPLTRIRDIAHRNDIPQELKREIKTTLQNKLHRNAGPEDLETSSRLLERITAPGAEYPPSFIEEFRTFHRELREFFNAGPLDEKLAAIARTSEENETGMINAFLDAKAAAKTTDDLIAVFGLLTQLRELFSGLLRGKEDSGAQQLLAADIGMEDFSFVLLSRIINNLESGKPFSWQSALHCLELSVKNLMISGFDREECRAIVSEISAWRGEFDGVRDQILRLKATLDRGLRLAEVYTHNILSLFPARAENLGRALGVDRHAIKVFAESEIRSQPVFQLSKLDELLLRNVRQAAGLPPWDIIVPGKVSGRLEVAGALPGVPAVPGRSVIAALAEVEGDEEIQEEISAIIVPHETPHLSHLAVRARQGRVVFAVCEDGELFSQLRALSGETITLDTTDGNVTFQVSGTGTKEAKIRSSFANIKVPAPAGAGENRLLGIENVTLENSGGKAFGARKLLELSRIAGSGFSTPRGAVIPFGGLEDSLKAHPGSADEYTSLIGKLESIGKSKTEGIPDRIRDIIAATGLAKEPASAIEEMFGADKRLMVRSSSNCEDLEGLSGAGLYKTVANVAPDRLADAVRSVWASLWTERAVMSRNRLGIRHRDARMAVLIQELIIPDYSFIIHTVNPVTGNTDEAYIELAAGLGEALAAGSLPGTPYRMACGKHAGPVRMLSFASFSHAFIPGPPGELAEKVTDYSRVELSTDDKFREDTGKRLADISVFVEKNIGRPQDIEGVISGEEIYLVQARPQQGVR